MTFPFPQIAPASVGPLDMNLLNWNIINATNIAAGGYGWYGSLSTGSYPYKSNRLILVGYCYRLTTDNTSYYPDTTGYWEIGNSTDGYYEPIAYGTSATAVLNYSTTTQRTYSGWMIFDGKPLGSTCEFYFDGMPVAMAAHAMEAYEVVNGYVFDEKADSDGTTGTPDNISVSMSNTTSDYLLAVFGYYTSGGISVSGVTQRESTTLVEANLGGDSRDHRWAIGDNFSPGTNQTISSSYNASSRGNMSALTIRHLGS